MKLLFIIGSGAVGKMTVGQELAKITDLRLYHNHMAIEQVIEIFGYYDGKTITDMRDAVFRNFAASDNYGMIFTYMWAFDQQADWDYIAQLTNLFRCHGAEVYYVELIASQEVRLQRNRTENRLANKPSKRDVEWSDKRLLADDANYRCVSREGEIPFANYLRLDNTNLSPAEAACIIRENFLL